MYFMLYLDFVGNDQRWREFLFLPTNMVKRSKSLVSMCRVANSLEIKECLSRCKVSYYYFRRRQKISLKKSYIGLDYSIVVWKNIFHPWWKTCDMFSISIKVIKSRIFLAMNMWEANMRKGFYKQISIIFLNNVTRIEILPLEIRINPESPSIIASVIPISKENSRAFTTAMASIYANECGKATFWDIEVITISL